MEVNYAQLENLATCAETWFTNETVHKVPEVTEQLITIANLFHKYDIEIPMDILVGKNGMSMKHLLFHTTHIIKSFATTQENHRQVPTRLGDTHDQIIK